MEVVLVAAMFVLANHDRLVTIVEVFRRLKTSRTHLPRVPPSSLHRNIDPLPFRRVPFRGLAGPVHGHAAARLRHGRARRRHDEPNLSKAVAKAVWSAERNRPKMLEAAAYAG